MNASNNGKAQLLKVFKNSLVRQDAAPVTARLKASARAAPVNDAGTNDIPEKIIQWLAQLTLLYGVPFEYLVPDAAMLPPESIRFFYIDQNWTNRLVDGAVNIALGSSQDYVHILTTFEQLAQQAALQQNNVRAGLRGKPLPETVQAGGTLTGVLLRSAVVSGWPGMDVSAFGDAQGKQPLSLLRMDRLSDNVLICLFQGVPALVRFSQPPEGLHFGVIGNPLQPGYQVALRGVGGRYPAGQQIDNDKGEAYTSPITFRDGNRDNGVLNIRQIKTDLISNLDALGALQKNGDTPLFTSSQFAVQMVKSAGLQEFKPGTDKICNGNTVSA